MACIIIKTFGGKQSNKKFNIILRIAQPCTPFIFFLSYFQFAILLKFVLAILFIAFERYENPELVQIYIKCLNS